MQPQNTQTDISPEEAFASMGLATKLNEDMLTQQNQQLVEPGTEGDSESFDESSDLPELNFDEEEELNEDLTPRIDEIEKKVDDLKDEVKKEIKDQISELKIMIKESIMSDEEKS